MIMVTSMTAWTPVGFRPTIREGTMTDLSLAEDVEWDGETLVQRCDRQSGALIIIAIHSTRLGPAGGGTRMRTYSEPAAAIRDALRLSAAMTYKFAVPGIARGGGKAVIALPASFDPRLRADLLRRYGALVRQLGGLFYTGPDVGTSDTDMDIVSETGAPYIFGRTRAAGGAGASGPITAFGVFCALQVVCEQLFGTSALAGRRVLVQGAGSVGGTLIDYLINAKAEVLFNDVDDAAVRHLRDERGVTFVEAERVYDTPCDLFAPCAMGGVLNRDTIARLRCQAVVGGANNQLATNEDADRLRARGILYAPDFVASVGGAMAIPAIETLGWSEAEAERQVAAAVSGALRRIFELSSTEAITTEAAARRIARDRLDAVAVSAM